MAKKNSAKKSSRKRSTKKTAAAKPGLRPKPDPAPADRTVAIEIFSDTYRGMMGAVASGGVDLPEARELLKLLEATRAWAGRQERPRFPDCPHVQSIQEIGWALDGVGGLRAMQLVALQVREADPELAHMLEFLWNGVGVWMV